MPPFILAALGFGAVIIAVCQQLAQMYGQRPMFRLAAEAGRHVVPLYLMHIYVWLGGIYLFGWIAGRFGAFLTPAQTVSLSVAFVGASLLLALFAAHRKWRANRVT